MKLKILRVAQSHKQNFKLEGMLETLNEFSLESHIKLTPRSANIKAVAFNFV